MNKLFKKISVLILLVVLIVFLFHLDAQAFVFSRSSVEYIADASAADQGATGDGKTIKAYVDAIGTSKKATIVLKHSSAGNTTTHTLTTNETIPSNIILEIENGAILDGAGTLTINGPFKSGLSKAFGSSITILGLKTACPEWWGENTTPGTTDMATEIQAAIDSIKSDRGGIVFFSPDKYRINSGLTIDDAAVILQGSGWGETSADGSWIYIDNISIDPITFSGYAADGSQIRDLAFEHDQPTPGPAWSPNNYNWLITIDGVDNIEINHVMMLNPTYGIKQIGSSNAAGRLHIDGLYGQPFKEGMRFERMMDVIRIENVHFWPFWNNDSNVYDYIYNNLLGIVCERVDNPHFSNIFILQAYKSILFTSGTYGVTSKFHIANADLDGCVYGVFIDGDNTTGQIANLTIQGTTTTSANVLFKIDADNCDVQISNIWLYQTTVNGLRIDGTGNYVYLSNVWIDTWNTSSGGYAAIEPATGNYVYIENRRFSNGNGGADISGAGTTTFSRDAMVGGSINIASAATINLLGRGEFFNITGTTNITSITASWIGRVVTLVFSDVLTFTDGSNLKIAGNFVTTADDTITLIAGSVNWYEISRSVN